MNTGVSGTGNAVIFSRQQLLELEQAAEILGTSKEDLLGRYGITKQNSEPDDLPSRGSKGWQVITPNTKDGARTESVDSIPGDQSPDAILAGIVLPREQEQYAVGNPDIFDERYNNPAIDWTCLDTEWPLIYQPLIGDMAEMQGADGLANDEQLISDDLSGLCQDGNSMFDDIFTSSVEPNTDFGQHATRTESLSRSSWILAGPPTPEEPMLHPEVYLGNIADARGIPFLDNHIGQSFARATLRQVNLGYVLGVEEAPPNGEIFQTFTQVSPLRSSSRLLSLAPKPSLQSGNPSQAVITQGAKSNTRTKRKPFQDARVQKQTADTRRIKACVRCRMQRIRASHPFLSV